MAGRAAAAALLLLVALVGSAEAVRVCIPKAAGEFDAAECAATLNAVTGKPASVTFTCVPGKANAAAPSTCLEQISNGNADLTTALGGNDLYDANENGLVPIIQETYAGARPFSYYSVAVVKRAFCTANPSATFRDLKGKKMCSTGYRKTAGWSHPIGTMISMGVIPVRNGSPSTVQSDAAAAAAFFSDICAYGITTDGPQKAADGSGQKMDQLCSLCQTCEADEPYTDYEGALRCLAANDVDTVAFTKAATLLEDPNKDDYMLLCPSGGCMEVDRWQDCRVGVAAARAFIGRGNYAASGEGLALANWLANGPATFVAAAKTVGVLSADAVGLRRVTESFDTYFGTESMEATTALRTVQSKPNMARICLSFTPATTGFLDLCTSTLNGMADPGLGFTCMVGGSSAACMELVKNDFADLMVGGADDMYNAYKRHQLTPVVAEVLVPGSTDPTPEYYSVAVVKKSFCDARQGNVRLRDLQGQDSCHTGYRKAAGWTLPLGYMLKEGIMPYVNNEGNVKVDAQSASSFFGRMCAPRTTADGPAVGTVNGQTTGIKYSPLCEQCDGDCTESVNEPYNDYLGAMRCLADDAGKVAFVKYQTAVEDPNKDNLRIICPATGRCESVDSWEQCNLGTAPAKSMIARPDYKDTPFGGPVISMFSSLTAGQLSSLRQLGGQKNFVFSASAEGTRAITTSFTDYFGADTLEAYDKINAVGGGGGSGGSLPGTLRYCTVSDGEQAFCKEAMVHLNDRKVGGFSWDCVQRPSSRDCMLAIENGEAEWRTMDGGDIYEAHHEFGLVAVLAETYGGEVESDLEYYAVAVVRKGFCGSGTTLGDLKGKRMCATGYQKTAGWNMPVGLMLQSGIMPLKRDDPMVEDSAESAAAFFSSMCAPRTTSSGPLMVDGKGAKWDKMCTNCAGDCSGTSAEPYQDYAGALRCMFEEKGDVAFVKHSTALQYAEDGSSPTNWPKTLKQDEMRLLCPFGGCAEVGKFAECNFARVPSHAVMVNEIWSDAQITRFQDALILASTVPAFKEKTMGPNNVNTYVFKAGTERLTKIEKSTRSFLGSALGVYFYLDQLSENSEIPAVAGPEAGDKGVPKGAAAGIGIGCAIAGALLVCGPTSHPAQAQAGLPEHGGWPPRERSERQDLERWQRLSTATPMPCDAHGSCAATLHESCHTVVGQRHPQWCLHSCGVSSAHPAHLPASHHWLKALCSLFFFLSCGPSRLCLAVR